MDPTIYWSAFIGFVAVCLLATVLFRPPMRACPACGTQTKLDGRQCRHCGYVYGRMANED